MKYHFLKLINPYLLETLNVFGVSFKCGFQLPFNDYFWIPSDIDECRVSSKPCVNGKCENLPGRYECVCDEGFEDPFNMLMCMGECIIENSSTLSPFEQEERFRFGTTKRLKH